MSKWPYSEEELKKYFSDPSVRQRNGNHGQEPAGIRPPSPGRKRTVFDRWFNDPQKSEAAFGLSVLGGAALFVALILGIYFLFLAGDLPSFEQLDNPNVQLATVAYTADGVELARYAFQNRSWVTYEEISPNVVNALIATEDHRFYGHWGIDLFRTVSAVLQTVFGDTQGGSTITQQLARNLYNEQIGKEQTIGRKMKEMVTAVQLERRYTKREIVEMYLNTIEYVYNAFGIEAAARTFFGKPAAELDINESATLIGMLQNPSRYNPIRFPERSQRRRNVVLSQMQKHGFISEADFRELKEAPLATDFNSSEITASLAPYFAEYVRNWLREWAKETGRDVYAEGMVVYTTLDSRLQMLAKESVDKHMPGLQAVVDYEWSCSGCGGVLSGETAPYVAKTGYTPFSYFFQSNRDVLFAWIRDTERYKTLREEGVSADVATTRLSGDNAFMDSLRTVKTRLEAGLVSIDPRNGYVKAWVGGRDLKVDWYDHVAIAQRQPGSTFKPFVYTAAIDVGYTPDYTLPDAPFVYRDPSSGQVWAPGNFDGGSSGGVKTLRQALAQSNNLITARVITQLVNPTLVAQYAHRMGIKSKLDPVPALGLGTSDVTLLEMGAAYSTLANGGLYYEPTVVTRIEDRFGNVLYEAVPAPEEALSEATAYTVVDMMRGVIDYGTGQRIKGQYGLGGYDLAGKTGTTQNAADTWFMLMHPDLVTGAWVGFNDRRVTFRSTFWGQGAHTALHLVGTFFKGAAESPEVQVPNERFPSPQDFGVSTSVPIPVAPLEPAAPDEQEGGRVGW